MYELVHIDTYKQILRQLTNQFIRINVIFIVICGILIYIINTDPSTDTVNGLA